jgi:uncharacterized protein DUF6878
MTDTPETETLARQLQDLADRIDAHNKGVIFDALAETGIHAVTVSFDGYSDSGQIESIEAFDAENHELALPGNRQVRLMLTAPDDPPVETTLRDAIETLTYQYLETTHMGWEDNEGAYGTFVFAVPGRTITLEHNERVIEVETSHHNF